MELKVWVEGIQRIVCGVTVNTTCQDVVFALAHATGKVGRFTLIERWRNNERLLGPNENPLKLLLKWGEYANDVQFILQRSENKQQQINNNSNTTTTPMDTTSPNSAAFKKPLGISNANNSSQPINDKMKEIKHNFGENENIGIVRGIPQRVVSPQKSQQQQKHQSVDQIVTSPIIRQQPQMKLELENASPVPIFTPKHEKSHSNPVEMTNSNSFKFYATDFAICDGVGGEHNKNNIYHQLGAQNSKSINEINLAEVRSALDRRVSELNDSVENNNKNTSSEYLLDVYNMNTKSYNNAPTISANGALVPPPYRDPPPPRNSPQQKLITNPFLNEEYKNDYNKSLEGSESVFPAAQYKDLLQLIKFQRDKISTQQVELSKYDAEIVFLENKERDQAQELEAISREITKADQILRQGSDQLQTLQYVEEENELVKQQEKTLKSEITLLRSKLTNCETELMQCKNKIRLLMDDIELEQRKISTKEKNYRQNMERDFLIEMERIQSEIDQAIQSTDTSNKTAENLKKEIVLIENAIAEKKRQVEQLVNEMKEVNLQSLTVTTSEEIKHLFEGNNKPGGSSRRILGSPRQLENAVPTSKNPHGVWV